MEKLDAKRNICIAVAEPLHRIAKTEAAARGETLKEFVSRLIEREINSRRRVAEVLQ